MNDLRPGVILWLLSVIAIALSLPQPPRLDWVLIGGAIAAGLLWLGMITAGVFNKGAPLLVQLAHGESLTATQWQALAISALVGILLAGGILLVMFYIFAPIEPRVGARLAARANQPWWNPWALAFEASITEEVLCRLFLMSATVWVLNQLFPSSTSEPHTAIIWIALIVSAISFGAIHLPSWFAVVAPTPFLIIVVILLNGIGGLAFGQIYWSWGIEAAIVAHFFADVVVQSIGPRLAG